MLRHVRRMLIVLATSMAPLWSCSCSIAPACAYPRADIIFLGRVAFTNHDDSLGIVQATLVRFQVEEVFKGLAPAVNYVWVDPGSFTSCYDVYKLGQLYVVFATKRFIPPDTPAMTLVSGRYTKSKPLPPGFNPAEPPAVYYAPECTSYMLSGNPRFEQDLRILRAYRAGVAFPRIFGTVHLHPFRGWPNIDGPRLEGAEVTISNSPLTFKATTDDTGAFSVPTAPPGHYEVRAQLAPYRMLSDSPPLWSSVPLESLVVPEDGCGYTDVPLTTTSTLQGVVLDGHGKPAPKIPVQVQMTNASSDANGLYGVTDENGQFTISGIPDAEVYLSAGTDLPDKNMRYVKVYYPTARSVENATALRLSPGEVRRDLTLHLEPPLEPTSVHIRVVDKEGRPLPRASISLYGGGPFGSDMSSADRKGAATFACLRGWKYRLEAAAERAQRGGEREVVTNLPLSFVCGAIPNPVVLVLDQLHPRRRPRAF
jgi:hypothetical protein